MPYRWSLPLLSVMLVGCATTAPDTARTVATETPSLSRTSLQRSSTETVDEHLFIPGVRPASTRLPANEIDLHQHDDVWERMVHSFALPECSDNESSMMWARWYAERPEYMARVIKRAQPWMWFIVEELEFRGMPTEIALLPVVESAFDPFAYSSGRALGGWQFIAETGRRYGLKQNWWYEGRRDMWASTHAALDYLMDLNDRFDGDWLLALAGYNSGEGRVEREVKKNLARGKPADFWSLSLPRETRGYVPKLLGLTCLFRNPAAFGFEIPSIDDKQVIAAVDIGVQSDLVMISLAAGVDIDILFTLNPGFNRWATSPEGPHRVVLPLEGAERIKAYLQETDPSDLMRWDQVTVQDGDTLSHLASIHNVPIDVIRSANNLNSNLIRPGQKLRLPREAQSQLDPLYVAAASELQRLQSGLIASDRVSHKVRNGETLSVIARRYKVSVKELQAWNNISDPRRLRAGHDLVVFYSQAPAPAREVSTQHTVQSGDSLWSISRQYKVKLNDLMRWNGLQSSSVLQPGQSLKIMF